MNERNPQSNPTAMLFFGGLLIGTVLTALYTPRSGRDMRARIQAKATKISDNLKTGVEQVEQKKEDIKSAASEKLSSAAKTFDSSNNKTGDPQNKK